MAHFKGLHLQKLLEQKAKETTQYKGKAEENITTAEKMIHAGRKVDADLSKAEDLLSDAKNAINNKNYQEAAEYAERAIEETKRAHYSRISAIISQAENMVTLTQKIGADVSRASEYINRSKSALDRDEYDRAVDFANQSWKENEKILREHLSKAFSQAQSLIVFGKNLGQDTSTAEESLRSAREAMESGNFELALSLTNQCVDAVGVGISEGVERMVEETKSLLENIDSEDDIVKVNDLLELCQKDLEKYDYEKAMNGAKRAKLEAENSLKKSISNKIANLEKNVEAADRSGTDTTKLKELLNNAKTAHKSGDHKKALEYLSVVKSEAEESQMQRVLNTIAQSRNSFIYAKKIGVDITAVLALLEKARELMKDGKYEEALKYAEKSKSDAESIVEEFQSTAAEIKYVQDSISGAEQIGVDLQSIKTALESAKAALMAKDFKKAKDLAKRCRDTIDSTLYTKVLEIVESAEQMMTIAEKLSATTSETSVILEDAVSAMKLKDYKKAVESANRYRSDMKIHLRTKLDDLVKTTETDFEKVGKGVNVDLADAKDMLEDAKKSLKHGDYETAYAQIAESRKEIDEAQWKEAKKIYEYIKENCETIKKYGGDVTTPERTLGVVLTTVEKKQFSKATEICDKALDELRVVEQKFAEESFFAAKLAVIEVKKTGGDITTLRDMLRIAKTAMESGDYKEGYKNSLKAKQEAEKQKTTYEETFEAMSAAAALIAEAKKFNVDATKSIERLLAARTAFEKCDYAKAMEYAYECRDEAKRIMSRFTSAKKIINVTERIAIAEKLGFDTSKAKETLERATSAIKSSDYVNAMDLATLSESEIDESLSGNINFNISSTESLITQARATGIDTSDAEKHVVDAKDSLTGKMYEDAVNSVNYAREAIVKVAEQSQKVINDLKRVEMKIQEAETLHIDMSTVKAILAQANESLKLKSYGNTQVLAAKAFSEVERAQKQFISNLTGDLIAEIDKAKAKKVKVSNAEELLDQSKTALEKMDIHTALDCAMKSKVELEKVMDQYESVAKAVQDAAMKIAEAEKSGAATKRAKDILKTVNDLVKEGRFVDAVEVASEAGAIAFKMGALSKSITENLKKVENQVRNITMMGADIDVSKAKDLAMKARGALEDGDYDIAQKLAEEGFSNIKSTLETNILGQLNRLESIARKCEAEGLDVSEMANSLDTIKKQMETAEYDMALYGLDNTNTELTKLMNMASPKTEIHFEVKQKPLMGEWTDVELILANTGRSAAKNIKVMLSGNAEVSEIKELALIKKNTTEIFPFKIKPKAMGDQSIYIKVELERVFDDKSRIIEDSKIINVGMPPVKMPEKPSFTLPVPPPSTSSRGPTPYPPTGLPSEPPYPPPPVPPRQYPPYQPSQPPPPPPPSQPPSPPPSQSTPAQPPPRPPSYQPPENPFRQTPEPPRAPAPIPITPPPPEKPAEQPKPAPPATPIPPTPPPEKIPAPPMQPAKDSILPPISPASQPPAPSTPPVPSPQSPLPPATPSPHPEHPAAPHVTTITGTIEKCGICFGKIKPGLPIIVCKCGKTYHQLCGARAGKCRNCGSDLPPKEPSSPSSESPSGQSQPDIKTEDQAKGHII